MTNNPTAKAHARLVSAMSDLHEALTDIQGVGDATADKVLALVGEYDTAVFLRRAEGGE